MLTVDRMQQLLRSVSYKPDWFFQVYDGAHEGPHLVIRTIAANAYDKNTTTELDVHSAIPPMADDQQFFHYLLWRLKRIEVHEAMEFFQIDNHPFIDPHRHNADRDEW
jgi:hypothetical protein